MEWHSMLFPKKMKFQSVPSERKGMVTVIWDEKSVVLVSFPE
jgi:hypothetical protein